MWTVTSHYSLLTELKTFKVWSLETREISINIPHDWAWNGNICLLPSPTIFNLSHRFSFFLFQGQIPDGHKWITTTYCPYIMHCDTYIKGLYGIYKMEAKKKKPKNKTTQTRPSTITVTIISLYLSKKAEWSWNVAPSIPTGIDGKAPFRSKGVGIKLSSCLGCLVHTEQANLLQHCIGLKSPISALQCFFLVRLSYRATSALPSCFSATPSFCLISPSLGNNNAILSLTCDPACLLGEGGLSPLAQQSESNSLLWLLLFLKFF